MDNPTSQVAGLLDEEGTATPPAGKRRSLILRTPTGEATFAVEFDAKRGVIVCHTGPDHRTVVEYRSRAVRDLWEHISAPGTESPLPLGTRGEEETAKPGTVEAWAMSADNPAGGSYGVTPNARGRFGTFIPPIIEHLGLAEFTHHPTGDTMRPRTMDDRSLAAAKRVFETRLASLENDADRAFCAADGLGTAPFPIAMYCFATVDAFSSYWAGWNDRGARDLKNALGVLGDRRSQSRRMSQFLEKYLGYEDTRSQLAIAFWRHKTMHTAEPRVLHRFVDGREEEYGWCIAGFVAPGSEVRNWGLYERGGAPGQFMFVVGVHDLVRDLKAGVLGPGGYFEDLARDRELQRRYFLFEAEAARYEFRPETG